MRLCMGSRRGFICRMKVGNLQTTGDMAAAHGLHRMKQRNSLGPPARDGQNYAVVHCTGYIKNWPPTGEFNTGFIVCTESREPHTRPSTICYHWVTVFLSFSFSGATMNDQEILGLSPQSTLLDHGSEIWGCRLITVETSKNGISEK